MNRLHLVPLDDDEIIEGEIVEHDTDLDAIADQVRSAQARFAAAGAEVIEASFQIGRCLQLARAMLPSNQEYGEWLQAQSFGFSRQWANVLQSAAADEPEVRLAVESQLSTGGVPNIQKAVRSVRNPQPDTAERDPSKPRRNPLPQQANDAAWALRKSVERMERIFADDRFGANRNVIAGHTRGQMQYAADALDQLLGRLNDEVTS